VRHRVAGNRINMPEARRRAAVRSMIDGLFLHEHIHTTTARAKAVQGEAEKLIAMAIRGHNDAQAHLSAVVKDKAVAEHVLAMARRSSFSLDQKVLSNEERETKGKFPLSPESQKRKEDELKKLQSDLLALFKGNRAEAAAGLKAAREAMVIELHARRTILKRLPRPLTVRKLFEQYVPRFDGRHGGYTRVLKLGYRHGDASEMARLELV
jgi:large subunit ribosomal protein L17